MIHDNLPLSSSNFEKWNLNLKKKRKSNISILRIFNLKKNITVASNTIHTKPIGVGTTGNLIQHDATPKLS